MRNCTGDKKKRPPVGRAGERSVSPRLTGRVYELKGQVSTLEIGAVFLPRSPGIS